MINQVSKFRGIIFASLLLFSIAAFAGDPGTTSAQDVKTQMSTSWKAWAPVIMLVIWAGVAIYGGAVVYKFASNDRDAGQHLLYLGVAVMIAGVLSAVWYS